MHKVFEKWLFHRYLPFKRARRLKRCYSGRKGRSELFCRNRIVGNHDRQLTYYSKVKPTYPGKTETITLERSTGKPDSPDVPSECYALGPVRHHQMEYSNGLMGKKMDGYHERDSLGMKKVRHKILGGDGTSSILDNYDLWGMMSDAGNEGEKIFGEEYPGESETFIQPPYPKAIDIDDGIERDIQIKQEIFGVIKQYGTEFEVMRFTLSNLRKDGITLQVISLGAALTAIICPDRKGVYKDVVLGFDDPQSYYSTSNPGFGRITSLCPLPYNLEKIVWDWDFNRDEGSVTFSTTFYKIDTILTVRYLLTTCNELVIDMRACGSKILPMSLTSQVYWNMAGHHKGEEALRHHALSINSDRIWKHYNYKLKNFIRVAGTPLDFRVPTLMNDEKIFGEKNFEHVYVVSKGSLQKVAFLARLIHPRSCRYLEIFSDQPWMLCSTFNKMPRAYPPGWDDLEICSSSEDANKSGEEDDLEVCSSDEEEEDENENLSKMSFPFMEELQGKEGAHYRKYGSFCITPLSDLTGFDPLLCSGKSYTHRIIYKIGVYRRYMRPKKSSSSEETPGEEWFDDVQDIEKE